MDQLTNGASLRFRCMILRLFKMGVVKIRILSFGETLWEGVLVVRNVVMGGGIFFPSQSESRKPLPGKVCLF